MLKCKCNYYVKAFGKCVFQCFGNTVALFIVNKQPYHNQKGYQPHCES